MQERKIAIVVVIAAIIGLAAGALVGYDLNIGKTLTTGILQGTTVTRTQVTIDVERINVTVTPYCCQDANLNAQTPCSTILATNYIPVQRLQYLIETDPSFIAAEQGQNYQSETNGPGGCGNTFNYAGGVNGTILDFYFEYTTDRIYTNNCGAAENFTYYLYVYVHLTEAGYNMSAIQISPTNSSEVTYSCSSTIVSTENTTATIAKTSDA